METSLHRELKSLYAGEAAQTEVRLGRFRIDAVVGDELVEVQHGSYFGDWNMSDDFMRATIAAPTYHLGAIWRGWLVLVRGVWVVIDLCGTY